MLNELAMGTLCEKDVAVHLEMKNPITRASTSNLETVSGAFADEASALFSAPKSLVQAL